eukprot:m51a1_g3618 putative ubiquitin-like protein smt3 (121) ;mRNA; f:83071-84091
MSSEEAARSNATEAPEEKPQLNAAGDKPAAPAGGAPAAGEHINLKVVGQDGTEVFFKIKKHTALKKLMDTYCQRQGIVPSNMRFLFEGKRINADQSPKDLNMEDGDIIDALLQQVGGRRC